MVTTPSYSLTFIRLMSFTAIHAMVAVDMSEQDVVVLVSSPGGTPVSSLCLHGGLGKATQPRDACGALAPQRGEKSVENDNARPDPFSRSLEDVVFLWRCSHFLEHILGQRQVITKLK